jgi:hypothetical protein
MLYSTDRKRGVSLIFVYHQFFGNLLKKLIDKIRMYNKNGTRLQNKGVNLTVWWYSLTSSVNTVYIHNDSFPIKSAFLPPFRIRKRNLSELCNKNGTRLQNKGVNLIVCLILWTLKWFTCDTLTSPLTVSQIYFVQKIGPKIKETPLFRSVEYNIYSGNDSFESVKKRFLSEGESMMFE